MKTQADLPETTRYWFDVAMQWSDARWGDEMGLLRHPLDDGPATDIPKEMIDRAFTVRDSVWYAAGLFMRRQDGDLARAYQAIESILTYQFDEPGTPYHGTFYRYPGEDHPGNDPIIWKDYDPNWREFICTVFIILLREFEADIPEALQAKMVQSIKLAAEGAFWRKVDAEYTNISLMSAFLLDDAGRRFDHAEWQTYAFEQAELIYSLFKRNDTFNEYNSPTYYGIDFYALALWRKYGTTDAYRQLGAEMETGLWRDMADFYHAGMRNLCGPYDRSYGMDMTDYLAASGLWIGAVQSSELAPLPDVSQPFDHAADFYLMPVIALVEALPPEDVLPKFVAFPGEQMVERTIEPNRTVTAWLSEKLMLGAEADNLNEERTNQFHPATAHWVMPDGKIGWLRLRSYSLVQATCEPNQLQLSSKEADDVQYIFQVRVTGASKDMIGDNRWALPGLTIELDRPDTPVTVNQDDDKLRIKFGSDGPVTMRFALE